MVQKSKKTNYLQHRPDFAIFSLCLAVKEKKITAKDAKITAKDAKDAKITAKDAKITAKNAKEAKITAKNAKDAKNTKNLAWTGVHNPVERLSPQIAQIIQISANLSKSADKVKIENGLFGKTVLLSVKLNQLCRFLPLMG